MANKKISELATASALTGTELVELVQGGANKKTTAQEIANLGGDLLAANNLNDVADTATSVDNLGLTYALGARSNLQEQIDFVFLTS